MFGQYAKVAKWTFKESALETDMMNWKTAQQEYTKTAGQTMDEDILNTVLSTRTPKVIREHLQLNIRNMACYNDFVDRIESYYGTKTFFGVKATDNSPGGLANMDVGALVAQIRRKDFGRGNRKGHYRKGYGKQNARKGTSKEKNSKVKPTTDQKVEVKISASQVTTEKEKVKLNRKVKLLARQATVKQKEN